MTGLALGSQRRGIMRRHGAKASDRRNRVRGIGFGPVPWPFPGLLAEHARRPRRNAGGRYAEPARRPRRNAGGHCEVLHDLPQRAVEDRRPGARSGGRRAPRRSVRDLGEGPASVARWNDAASGRRSSAAGVLHARGRLPGARARSQRRGAAESRLAAAGPPPDADRIRQRDPRSARAAGSSQGARLRHAAAGRQREQRLRQPG